MVSKITLLKKGGLYLPRQKQNETLLIKKVSQIKMFCSRVKNGLLPHKRDLLKYKKGLLTCTKNSRQTGTTNFHDKQSRQILTTNNHGKFLLQNPTVNSGGKYPWQILTANSHGKFRLLL